MADFTVNNQGSIVLLYPSTDAARAWVDEHIGKDNGFQPYYPTVVCEPRYLGDILEGIGAEGLDVDGDVEFVSSLVDEDDDG